MLTALGSQRDASRSQHRRDAGIDRTGGFETAVMPDMAADDLAGRAADDKEIPCAQLGRSEQFLGRLAALCRDGGKIKFGLHIYSSLVHKYSTNIAKNKLSRRLRRSFLPILCYFCCVKSAQKPA